MKTTRNSMLVVALVVTLGLLFSGTVFGSAEDGMDIGNYVWVDTNENGKQNETDTGVNGVKVTLYRSYTRADGSIYKPLGDPIVTANNPDTGKAGYYLFEDVVEGTYHLVFELPSGYSWTKQGRTGLVDELDSDVDANGVTDEFSMALVEGADGLWVGVDDLTRDAGLIEPPSGGPGVGTPGYWKNHPDAWPVDRISIGGDSFSKDAAICLMDTATSGDMTYVMFMHLVAAKLNVMVGNDAAPVQDAIDEGDAWMGKHPVGTGVLASSDAWEEGEPIKDVLDAYNNGELGVPERD